MVSTLLFFFVLFNSNTNIERDYSLVNRLTPLNCIAFLVRDRHTLSRELFHFSLILYRRKLWTMQAGRQQFYQEHLQLSMKRGLYHSYFVYFPLIWDQVNSIFHDGRFQSTSTHFTFNYKLAKRGQKLPLGSLQFILL